MEDDIKQLQSQVKELQNQLNDMKKSTSIPRDNETALVGRGFVSTNHLFDNNLFFFGVTTIPASGTAHLPIPGLNTKMIALAQDPNGGTLMGAQIVDGTYGPELIIIGTYTTTAHYIVFKPTDKTL